MTFERATHLVSDGDLNVSLAELHHAAELFLHTGVVVFDKAAALDGDFLAECLRDFSEYFARVMKRLESLNVDLDKSFCFNEICRRQHCRYDVRALRGESLCSPQFTLGSAPWSDFIRLVLGEDAAELWRGVVLSQYGSEVQHWHRDGECLFDYHDLPPHCVTIFVPLVPTTFEMGRTSFLPGSHVSSRSHCYKLDYNPSHDYDGEPCSALPFTTPEVEMGGFLAFDYRVVHRGDANMDHSMKRDRPMLYFVYSKPWFKDPHNFPTDAPLFT
eukprot:TRINITY_DN22474_c0_g1_i2.p1 TRINITY_DN22474_c0_g1~~TRINITY_DN22474_c0_g1_i2.p1  ORF type:complete len:272 (+),score=15.80 TRINITY_DN22474_c0_g1_i2:69-884(+)